MKKLTMTQELAALPVVDIKHVLGEINWKREYDEVNMAEQKRRSAYMQQYNKRKQ
jgi:hypothetical protein